MGVCGSHVTGQWVTRSQILRVSEKNPQRQSGLWNFRIVRMGIFITVSKIDKMRYLNQTYSQMRQEMGRSSPRPDRPLGRGPRRKASREKVQE